MKTVEFGDFRYVGDPVMSSKVYSDQDADELIFLNIERKERSAESLVAIIQNVSEMCFMPLTVGGGINSLEDADLLFQSGADKLIINSACYEKPSLLSSIANVYGAQSIVVSIDVRKNDDDGKYMCFSDCAEKSQNTKLLDHVSRVVDYGAGEIFINSIDRDGMMAGYDLDLFRAVSSIAKVPIIGCGGAGTFEHVKAAFLETDLSALACASLFNFGDNNPFRLKAHLRNAGILCKKV